MPCVAANRRSQARPAAVPERFQTGLLIFVETIRIRLNFHLTKQHHRGIAMKLTFAEITKGLLLCFALLGFAQLAPAQECTASRVAGQYGYTSTGTIVTPAIGPFTAVGHVTLDESGTFSGAQTTSIAGNLVDEIVQGTFAVNPDCTGTVTVYVYHGSTLARTSKLNMVWDNHQKEARGIFTTAGTAITIVAQKMFGE